MASESKNSAGRHTVRVGVFIPTQCQMLDAASIDVMGSMSHEDIVQMAGFMPQAVIDLAPSVKIHYIGSVKAGELIPLTANQSFVATNHYSDPEVAPGKLDIVLIPGPDPFGKFPEDAVAWLGAQGRTEGVDILSVCTGIFLCGEAGLIKGKSVCGPKGMQDLLRSRGYGEKELVGHKYRWIQDGNFWSGGGVTNGNDLVAAYCRATSKHFPRPIADIACELTDVGDRPREYGSDDLTYEQSFKKLLEAVK
ncbi:ThiJ/PfpI family protein [Hypoxylon trugodes]|uniref:ThiJ/PfpI family protein n=1 Tax=Hypoxylon trugodes TaxID=326681 RepID=UPI002194F533|nr:ThiJ/PfpI family protein [Hypoxylon trugodes]KAI1390172.1 ThiJ/PfpI family protein [Hypoxylon trugodes]